jgi:hypothetical protein
MYWDDMPALPGFGCRISQGGARTFILKCDNRRHTIGRWPTISLKDARVEAKRRLAQRTLGYVEAAAQRFDDVFKTYQDKHVATLRDTTAYEKLRLFEKNIRPHLRGKNLHAITTHNITDITDRLSATPTTAIHVHKALVAFFRWCQARRILQRSPCEALSSPGTIGSRTRVARAPR